MCNHLVINALSNHNITCELLLFFLSRLGRVACKSTSLSMKTLLALYDVN